MVALRNTQYGSNVNVFLYTYIDVEICVDSSLIDACGVPFPGGDLFAKELLNATYSMLEVPMNVLKTPSLRDKLLRANHQTCDSDLVIHAATKR